MSNESAAAPSPRTNSEARTTEQIAEKAHATIDRVAERSADAELRLREQAESAASKVRETEERARQAAGQSAEKVTGYVRENPMMSAGLAFVAGIVLSSLLRR